MKYPKVYDCYRITNSTQSLISADEMIIGEVIITDNCDQFLVAENVEGLHQYVRLSDGNGRVSPLVIPVGTPLTLCNVLGLFKCE